MKKKLSRSKRNRARRRFQKKRARKTDYQNLEPRHLLAGFDVDFGILDPGDYTHTEILVRFNDNVDVQSAMQHYSEGMFGPTSLPGPVGEGFQAQVTRTNDGRGYRCSVIVTGVEPSMLAARIRPIVAEKFGDRAIPNGDTSHDGQPSSWNIQGFDRQRLIGVGSTKPALVAGRAL